MVIPNWVLSRDQTELFDIMLNRIIRNRLFDHLTVCKQVVVIEVDPRAPFSIPTTPRFRGWRYSFPWIAPKPIPYNAEC